MDKTYTNAEEALKGIVQDVEADRLDVDDRTRLAVFLTRTATAQ